MLYRELAAFFERLEATPGRLGMTSILVELLGQAKPAEMTPVVRLLQGAVAPDWEGIEVGLAEKQILKALAMAQGSSTKSEETLTKLEALYHEKGDLGLAAEAVVGASKGKQASLFGASDLTVAAAFASIEALARTTGTGSQEAKQRLLSKLLLEASPLEARYLTRTIAGRLRLGVADMTFLDALAAWRIGRGVRSVTDMEDAERAEQEALRATLEKAYDFRSDLAIVATALATGGPDLVAKLGVAYGTPVRPMASERLKTLGEILTKMEGRVAMEYKYDGLRVQAHVSPAGVRLFSRRLEELTAQFPDVVADLAAHFRGRSLIVEGEAIALDANGRMRPFQDVSRRRGRKTDLDAAVKEIPITLFLFDCLADGSGPTMDLPFAERRARLAGLLGKGHDRIRLSAIEEVSDVAAMEAFFDKAVEEGAEGIMCKDPRAPYKAGSRGFAWIKFKTDYTEALVDTMDLVAVGAFYGRGRRAGWYGAVLMAAYDDEAGVWRSLCKLGTGFDDATLETLKPRFEPHVAPKRPAKVDSEMEPDVWFEPSVVMEVQAAELTLSPIHRAAWGLLKPGAGLAARFPRFTRWRDDKTATQATSVKEVVRLYETKG